MSGYIDFAEIKERCSIEQAAQKLGLRLTKSAHQLRGACPACQSGGDRALAVTPSKNLFYCFAAQVGGDQLAFAAHIRGCSTREAAEFLGGTVPVQSNRTGTGTSKSKDQTTGSPSPAGLAPLDYLEPEHPAVEAVGFNAEIAKALGIGYAAKGLMKGTVAIPVRLEDGTLAGYVGVIEARLPPKWHLEQKVVPFQKKTA